MKVRRPIMALAVLLCGVVCAPDADPSPRAGATPPSQSPSGTGSHALLGAVLRTAVLLGPAEVGRLDHITRVYPGPRGPMLGVLLEGGVRESAIRQLVGEIGGRSPNGVVVARVPVASLSALAAAPGLSRAQCALRRLLTTDRAVPLAFGHAVPRSGRPWTGRSLEPETGVSW